jgi:hypothetical protein
MKTYDTLIAADIYRDGGSLEARFRLADGEFVSLWLSVLPWDTPANKAYGALKVSTDADGAEAGRVVLVGSEEERQILASLRDFLRAPKVDVPFAHRTDSASFIEKVTWLSDEIPRRRK